MNENLDNAAESCSSSANSRYMSVINKEDSSSSLRYNNSDDLLFNHDFYYQDSNKVICLS